MPEQLLRGTPASPGLALGAAWRPTEEIRTAGPVPAERRDRERDAALAALDAAAEALGAVAAGLAPEEAEIVEAGALMARDPALTRDVETAVVSDGLVAADAIIRATGRYADAIAALGDETLAARADDVRSLGRRAARLARHDQAEVAPPGADLILIARDLGPADVAEAAPALAGVALVGGGATAHAAIVARSLDIPMVTGLEACVLELADGAPLALDGTSGSLTIDPSAGRRQASVDEMAARRAAAQRARAERGEPAATGDGRRIVVLVNVASPAELDVGLRAGAEGIGLLRTELAFLDAGDWPGEQDHVDALEPILAGLEDRPAVVRVLDFGADKSPPFLAGVPARGLELLLGHRDALAAQLRAIIRCGQDRDVRILLPMVDRPEQLTEARAMLEQAARALGAPRVPPLGSMIETPLAAENAPAIAAHSDFLSIGTNDLTAATLGVDRFAANTARAHDPRVLRLIARSVGAAHAAGIAIEVCGEAASDPVVLPLLLGLGVDEVSVGAARVGPVRRWIRQLHAGEAETAARSALAMETAQEVELDAGLLVPEPAHG